MPTRNYGLGRRPAFDQRDERYLLRKLRPEVMEKKRPTRRAWDLRQLLNQGTTPACTGYSAKYLLLAAPVRQKAPELTADDIYHGAQDNDEWAGSNYEGSSVRGAMKFLQLKGKLTTYGWATNIDEVLQWLAFQGPVVLGTDWYTGMFDIDAKGFVNLTGQVEGGHAYVIRGYDEKMKALIGKNSWGKWGVKNTGLFYLRYEDADKLIKDEGEAATATEVTL